VQPSLWDERLASRVVGAKTVAWLMAVPVSEAEANFAEQNGLDALETRFEQREVDVTDLERGSAV
jgi:antitoxin YqcF